MSKADWSGLHTLIGQELQPLLFPEIMQEQGRTVQLGFRVPVVSSAEFSLQVILGISIQQLKKELQSSHPIRPPEAEQRLIFKGKLLKDEQTIEEILGVEVEESDGENEFIFHLVLRSGNYSPRERLPVEEPPILKTARVQENEVHSRASNDVQADSASSAQIATVDVEDESAVEGPSIQTSDGQVADSQSMQSTVATPVPAGVLAYVPHLGRTVMIDPSQLMFLNGVPYISLDGPMAAQERETGNERTTPPPANREEANLRRANHVWLIFKLAFFSMLLSHNAGMSRILVIYLISFVVYLVQAGWIKIESSTRNASVGEPANPATEFVVESLPMKIYREVKNLIVPLVSSLVPGL